MAESVFDANCAYSHVAVNAVDDYLLSVNAKAKRKARREELPPTLVETSIVETISTVERYEMTNPCPKCGLTELRRIAGTDSHICYRCK